jgi:hypothetical protein
VYVFCGLFGKDNELLSIDRAIDIVFVLVVELNEFSLVRSLYQMKKKRNEKKKYIYTTISVRKRKREL